MVKENKKDGEEKKKMVKGSKKTQGLSHTCEKETSNLVNWNFKSF